MSLIKCEDCGNDVSSIAVNCPKCGRPVLVQTTEKASKSLKGNKFLSGIFFVGKYLMRFIKSICSGVSVFFSSIKNRIKEGIEKREAQEREFRESHKKCPKCEGWSRKASQTCNDCYYPFSGDPALVIAWGQGQTAKENIESSKKERRNRRGNAQGCGCLLMLLGGLLCMTIVGIAPGSTCILIGFIVLIVGMLL